jgi:hypothetical protein
MLSEDCTPGNPAIYTLYQMSSTIFKQLQFFKIAPITEKNKPVEKEDKAKAFNSEFDD